MWSSFFTKLSIFGSIDYEPFPHFLIICAGHLHNCQNPCLETATIINSDSLQQEVVCSDDYHPVEGFVSTDNTSIGGLFCAQRYPNFVSMVPRQFVNRCIKREFPYFCPPQCLLIHHAPDLLDAFLVMESFQHVTVGAWFTGVGTWQKAGHVWKPW